MNCKIKGRGQWTGGRRSAGEWGKNGQKRLKGKGGGVKFTKLINFAMFFKNSQ